MEVTCHKCKSVSNVTDSKVPVGRSYMLCPTCRTRINMFKGVKPGVMLTNLMGLRFQRYGEDFHEVYCEPGELWKVIEVTEPCPHKDEDEECERRNKGACPNQSLIVRLNRDRQLYSTCLYRLGRRLFDKATRHPVGAVLPFEDYDEDVTYRVR
ncbi:zinc-ribbon domain-containing protein [Thermodesulfobacteriota bacterium]